MNINIIGRRGTMRITINGEVEDIEAKDVTIARLLEIKKVESPDMVSVQVNGTIIEREQYGVKVIAENDELEFLYFMGGGAI